VRLSLEVEELNAQVQVIVSVWFRFSRYQNLFHRHMIYFDLFQCFSVINIINFAFRIDSNLEVKIYSI